MTGAGIESVAGEWTAKVAIVGRRGDFLLVLEGEVVVSRPGTAPGRFEVAPGVEMLSPVLGDLPVPVVSLSIQRSGELILCVRNSLVLTTVVDPDYESGQLFDPLGTMFRLGPGPNVGVYPPLPLKTRRRA